MHRPMADAVLHDHPDEPIEGLGVGEVPEAAEGHIHARSAEVAPVHYFTQNIRRGAIICTAAKGDLHKVKVERTRPSRHILRNRERRFIVHEANFTKECGTARQKRSWSALSFRKAPQFLRLSNTDFGTHEGPFCG